MRQRDNKKIRLIAAGLSTALLLAGCGKNNTDDLGGVSSDPLSESGASAGNSSRTEELLSTAKVLLDQGQEVFWWYMGEGESLDVEQTDDYTQFIRKVGRFATIRELKDATEAVFSREFCEEILYPTGFNEAQGDNIKFREIDGVLHINQNNGGMGWVYALTDRMELVSAGEDEAAVLVYCDYLGGTEPVPVEFRLVREPAGWRLDSWYDYHTQLLPSLKEAVANPEKYENTNDRYLPAQPEGGEMIAWIYQGFDGENHVYRRESRPVPDYMVTLHDYLEPIEEEFGDLLIENILLDGDEIFVNFAAGSPIADDSLGDEAWWPIHSIAQTIRAYNPDWDVRFEVDRQPFYDGGHPDLPEE